MVINQHQDRGIMGRQRELWGGRGNDGETEGIMGLWGDRGNYGEAEGMMGRQRE